MDWRSHIDAYCERIDPGFWSEPINALTNLAFLVAALWVWPRVAGLPLARALAATLFAIGMAVSCSTLSRHLGPRYWMSSPSGPSSCFIFSPCIAM